MAIFGNKKTFEAQWKAIFTKRLPKRGTSEMFRKIDAGLKPKDYDRQRFLADVLSSKNDAVRFHEGLAKNKQTINAQYVKFKDWSAKEKAFFTTVMNEIETERVFWKGQADKMA